MQIRLNGKNEDISQLQEGGTLHQLITQLENQQYFGSRKLTTFAVAVNRNFVPKGQYQSRQIQPHDEVEIIFPHPGG